MNDEIKTLIQTLVLNKWIWSISQTQLVFTIDGLSIQDGVIVGSWKAKGTTLMFEYKGQVVWSLESVNEDELHLLGYSQLNKTWVNGYLKKI